MGSMRRVYVRRAMTPPLSPERRATGASTTSVRMIPPRFTRGSRSYQCIPDCMAKDSPIVSSVPV
jgi:hypothetical protein